MACVSRCFISVWFPGKNLQKLEDSVVAALKNTCSVGGLPWIAQVAEGWSHQTAQGSIQRICGFDGLALQISRGKCYIVECYGTEWTLQVLQIRCISWLHVRSARWLVQPFFGPSHWNFITEHEPYSYITSAQSVSCPLCSGGCYVQ